MKGSPGNNQITVLLHLRDQKTTEGVLQSLVACGIDARPHDADINPDDSGVHIHDTDSDLSSPDHAPPPVARLLLYTHLNSVLFERAVANGYRGFLDLADVPDRICEAVSLLASGQAFLDQGALDLLLARNGSVGLTTPNYDHAALDTLTPREREVFEALVRGMSIREIGVKLAISERTVEVHRRRILERLGLSNVVQLFHLAFKAGVVTQEELIDEFSARS